MERRKKLFLTVFLIVLFFISSCGIPSYLTCNLSKSSSTEWDYIFKLYNFRINATEYAFKKLHTQLVDSSPSVTFFYTITNTNGSNSSITSNFRSLYSSEDDKPKSASILGHSNVVATYKSNDKNLNLYVMGNAPWSSESGHLNRLNEDKKDASFSFSLNSELSTDNFILVNYIDASGNESVLTLGRYDGSSFNKQTNETDFSAVDQNDNLYINIYVALNLTGNNMAEFTNRFWSNLYYLKSVEL